MCTNEKAPYGRELPMKSGEGESANTRSVLAEVHAGSLHHSVVPLPPGGRLYDPMFFREGGPLPYDDVPYHSPNSHANSFQKKGNLQI